MLMVMFLASNATKPSKVGFDHRVLPCGWLLYAEKVFSSP